MKPKESAVTFVSRWFGKTHTSPAPPTPHLQPDVSAAAKSCRRLTTTDRGGLITLINGRGVWGGRFVALLSVSLQLKRSHRKPEERVSPAGAAVSPLHCECITWGGEGRGGRVLWPWCKATCLQRISLTRCNAARGAGRAALHASDAFQSKYTFSTFLPHTCVPCEPLFLNYVLYFTMTK